MTIKVCGMRDPDNIRQVDAIAGVDWMGFIFFPKSSRNVTAVPSYLPQHCQRVGVFVNAPVEDIVSRVQAFGFHLVQLHGDESPAFCHTLRTHLPDETRIIKMIQVASEADILRTEAYAEAVDYFLFETKCVGYGGSGQQFDWGILQHYHSKTPFLITGGIGPEDAEKVKAFQHPQFAGIDLNSRFETSPAVKNATLINDFIKKLL